MLNRISGGYVIALGASVCLLGSAILFLFVISGIIYFLDVKSLSLEQIAITTRLPVLAALGALGTIGGSAASIVALAVYGFRSKWFWYCLVATSILWLFAIPLGSVIGLIALVVLMHFRKAFSPASAMPVTQAP